MYNVNVLVYNVNVVAISEYNTLVYNVNLFISVECQSGSH